MNDIEEMNRPLREAVAARLAAKAAREPSTVEIPGDLPEEFRKSIAGLELRRLLPVTATEPEPMLLGATMPTDQLAAAWQGVRQRADEAREKINSQPRDETAEVVWSASEYRRKLIGIAGRAGAGKNTVAEMIPGAAVFGFADPLYAGLAAMLGVPENILRNRRNKDTPLKWLGKSPRELMQALGTEWGRGMVAQDLWLRIAKQRIETYGGTIVFSDVRFDNEAEWIRNQGGEVWLVEGEPKTSIGFDAADHVSESGISPALIDRVIDNRGTFDQTRLQVAEILAG